MEKIVRCPVLLDNHDDMLETRHLRVSEQRPKEKQQRTSKGEFHPVVGRRNYLRVRARTRTVAAIKRRRNQRGEDDVTLRRFAAFHPDRIERTSDSWLFVTTRSTHKLVVLALLFVLFRFVVLAQHFTVRVDFNANLLPVLLNNGFIIGAFLLPAND